MTTEITHPFRIISTWRAGRLGALFGTQFWALEKYPDNSEQLRITVRALRTKPYEQRMDTYDALERSQGPPEMLDYFAREVLGI